LPPASPPQLSWRCAGFIKPAAIWPRKPPSVLSPFAQLRCYLRWGDVSAISSEGVTPPSSLLRAHVPLPLSSPLLRHLASFEESWQVVHSPCCPRELPDVISENLSLDAGSCTPAVHRVLSPVSSTMSSAFPKRRMGRLPAFVPRITTSRRPVFRGCRYSVMFRPPSLLSPQIVPTAAILPQGSRGFYVRAYRALLPPHAPDMLTVRVQVIDGTGTFTLSDSQPCRLLTSLRGSYSASSLLRTHPPPSRLRSTSRLGRLYDLPCSGDFAPGRGGLRQLLGMSSSPCCRFHPAEVAMPHRSDFGTPFCLRPPEAGSALGSGFSRPHLRSLSLRPGDSWSPPRETLSIGFRILVSRHPAIQTTGRLTFAPAGLSPAEHTSFYWTHFRTAGFPRYG
jgi:hypothetical protein